LFQNAQFQAPINNQKCCPKCDFGAQNTPEFVCGRGLAPDSTGELTALPTVLSWFAGGRFAAGMEGRKEKGRGGGKERGEKGRERSLTSIFYNLSTASSE